MKKLCTLPLFLERLGALNYNTSGNLSDRKTNPNSKLKIDKYFT